MDEQELSKLLKRVWAQRLTVDEAMRELKAAPYEQLKHARVDHHRSIRWGFPEVIYCEGKSPQDITEIARAILQRSSRLLATRASAVAYAAVQEADANAIYHDVARCITVTRSPPEAQPGRVVVICAGTADIPVAEEARITASMLGFDVETVYDAGVAGIHRLLVETSKIQSADAIVVVAGMEGALASVVGGLAEAPVIAVPTSVGTAPASVAWRRS